MRKLKHHQAQSFNGRSSDSRDTRSRTVRRAVRQAASHSTPGDTQQLNMLCALEKAEVDALELDDSARRALEELDGWNEDEARRLVDRMHDTGSNAIHNKSGYVITSVRKINEYSGNSAATEGGHDEAAVAGLAEAEEEYSEENEYLEEEEEEHDGGEGAWYDEDGEHYEEEGEWCDES